MSVTDHGVGIARERQAHVFEPFHQSVPPGTLGYTETVDLGLYLSKEIVGAHGGRIWCTSTPGQGAVFAFSVHLAENAVNALV